MRCGIPGLAGQNLRDLECGYLVVPRTCGQQMKDPAQLDAWVTDGIKDYVASLCRFNNYGFKIDAVFTGIKRWTLSSTFFVLFYFNKKFIDTYIS